ncbi:hypothetical protein WEH80_18805 [Actinomycetes bacterium KLBMP 9759]
MPGDSSEAVLDHIVLATRSRDDVDSLLTELGLAAGSGRSIPGAGLSNVVVAVGTQLLEFHYPDGGTIDEGSPPFARVQREALTAHPDVAAIPVAWLVRYPTEDLLRRASARVALPVIEVPAEPPNDAPYLLGGFGAAFERPWLPAFIHWPRFPHVPPPLVGDRDRGPNEGWLGLDVSGPEDELRAWCGSIPRGVTIEAGNAGPLRARIHHADTGSRTIGLPATGSPALA